MMNLAKALKKKRDAEERLRKRSPEPTFIDTPAGGSFLPPGDIATKGEIVTTFNGLTDTPSSYVDQEGKIVKVNSTADGLEFGDPPASSFTTLTDAPSSYTGQSGKVVAVKSTEDGLEFVTGGSISQASSTTLGGIKAADKTSSETQEVKIDPATGFLYTLPADEATNGIPGGGTAGQILSKVDGTDYNTAWADAPADAESILTKAVNIADFTGKDGYVLAYDETAGEFYLKPDEGGGGEVEPTLHLDGLDNTGSGHSGSATTWKDLTGTVSDAALVAGNRIWGANYLRLDGSSNWRVNAPNGSRGTMELVVSIDADFTPVSTTNWYSASCIFGAELNGIQRDFGVLVNTSGYFAIGHSISTIYASAISALDGEPHTITYSYFNGPITFAIDGEIINEFNIGVAGNVVSTIGIGWNNLGTATRVKGNIHMIKWFNEMLTADQISANHAANKLYYGF